MPGSFCPACLFLHEHTLTHINTHTHTHTKQDPASTRVCGTCHTHIDYSSYQQFGSVLCKAISWPLDHPHTLRLLLGVCVCMSMSVLALPLSVVVIRLLTSGVWWRQHALWSRVIYGPLPLKIVMYRYVCGCVWGWFVGVEGRVREWLAEVESVLLERALPVTVHAHTQKEE